MRKIDYIYKHFDINAFCKNLKKQTRNNQCEEGGEFLAEIVILSTRNISQIKKELNYHQFTNNNNVKNAYVEFLKKFKNSFSDKDIEKFFFEKKYILNTEDYDYSEWKNLLSIHVTSGEFFRKFKKYFEITYYGHLSYMEKNEHLDSPYEDIICLYVIPNKKFYLFFYGYERNGNDSSGTIKIFNKRPSQNQLERVIKSTNILRYSDLAKNYKWKKIIQKSNIIKFDKEYNRIFSDGYKLQHKEELYFKNEEDYFNYHNTKGESHIAQEMAISNPEKYFTKHFKNWKQVSSILGGSGRHGKSKIQKKVKDNTFFKFIMSNRFNYRNSIKFIEDIIYSYDDLEGLLNYVPKKIQESKSLKEEIRILRLFRGNNKKFIIKVFQTNKDKLEDLVKYYMPSTIFDDSYLMNELIKLDINFTADIGDKLKKNKKFMSKVNKLLPKK